MELKRFDYQSTTCTKSNLDEVLNSFGNCGWNLGAMTECEDGKILLVFKRSC